MGEAPLSFVLRAQQVVRRGLGQVRREGDAEAGPEGAVVREAPGEVALDDNRGAGGEVLSDLLGGSEQGREVEAQAGLDALPQIHLAPQRLVEERHGGDQNGAPGRREQWRDRGLPASP